MREKEIELQEERDLGQKINATFWFLRQNFKPLAKSMLLYVVPFALLAGIFSGIYQSTQLAEATGGVQYGSFGAYAFASTVKSAHYWISMLFSLVSLVILCLTVYSYMLAYGQNKGEVAPAEVWDSIKENFVPMLYSSIGVVVVLMLGTLVLVLPGIYMGVALSMFAIVMLREDVGFVEALERCFDLVKENWWRTFGYLCLMLLLQWVIGFVASLPAIAVYMLRILNLPGGENEALLIVASSVTTILSLLLYVITITAVAFQYFDLVERKEGWGLLQQVHQIGAQEQSVSSPDYH